jgi:hypothetical protein
MKHLKHAFETHEKKTPENTSHVGKHMQHLNETLVNIRLENEMKYSEHTLETYVYSHYNMCIISIYFCNIKMKHLQHTNKTSETFETYSCNVGFARTNGGTPSWRSMAAHGPRCTATGRVTRRRA